MQARRLGSRAADVSRVANDRLPVRPTGSIPVARTAGFGASRPLWTRVSDGSRSKTPTTRRKRGEATCSTGRGSGLRARQASGRDQTLDRCAYFSAAAGRSAGRAAESLTEPGHIRCIRKARRPHSHRELSRVVGRGGIAMPEELQGCRRSCVAAIRSPCPRTRAAFAGWSS